MATIWQPAYRVEEVAAARLPILLSSPHSGLELPEALLARIVCSRDDLRALEDGPVDRLMRPAVEAGAVLVAARYHRAVVDLNRAQDELDPASFDDLGGLAPRVSSRVRAGLGVVPTRVGERTIYPGKLAAADLADRLAGVHDTYHAALAAMLERARAEAGCALLVDCHSMPTGPAWQEGGLVDIALGDRFGRSCDPELMAEARAVLTAEGFRVGVNRPYAGGHITERFGRPASGVHALQIELRRSLFMNEVSHEPHGGMARLEASLATLIRALARRLAALHLTSAA